MHSNLPLPSRSQRIAAGLAGPRDVLVIGGGITGAGVALDLAQRGLKVTLVERADWASKTSSCSSRLIHGGLRYLEQADFKLVRESCIERKRLMHNAAGLVWPERFLFPLHRGAEIGPWKLGAGLLLYSALSVPHTLGWPGRLSRQQLRRSIPGIQESGLRGAGHYLDGATDDSRLTLAVVQTALASGASALSRMEAVGLESCAGGIVASLRDTLSGREHSLEARAVVLAAGPYTDGLRQRAGLTGGWLAPTRGAHVLVPRARLPIQDAVILPSGVDGRILFLLPWPRYTVIGTTDIDIQGEPELRPRATAHEVRYLLDSANGLVPAAALETGDVVSTYAGLRPLLRAEGLGPSARSREERIEREDAIYTIAGGKLTGYRSMAEKLGARIARDLGVGNASKASPTRELRLSGALKAPVQRRDRSSSLEADALRQCVWQARYGSHAPDVARLCERANAGGQAWSADTLRGELQWAIEREDCLTAEDFFFRRTDLGLEPRERAEQLIGEVTSAMGAALGWDAERSAAEQNCVLQEIQARHAWRQES